LLAEQSLALIKSDYPPIFDFRAGENMNDTTLDGYTRGELIRTENSPVLSSSEVLSFFEGKFNPSTGHAEASVSVYTGGNSFLAQSCSINLEQSNPFATEVLCREARDILEVLKNTEVLKNKFAFDLVQIQAFESENKVGFLFHRTTQDKSIKIAGYPNYSSEIAYSNKSAFTLDENLSALLKSKKTSLSEAENIAALESFILDRIFNTKERRSRYSNNSDIFDKNTFLQTDRFFVPCQEEIIKHALVYLFDVPEIEDISNADLGDLVYEKIVQDYPYCKDSVLKLINAIRFSERHSQDKNGIKETQYPISKKYIQDRFGNEVGYYLGSNNIPFPLAFNKLFVGDNTPAEVTAMVLGAQNAVGHSVNFPAYYIVGAGLSFISKLEKKFIAPDFDDHAKRFFQISYEYDEANDNFNYVIRESATPFADMEEPALQTPEGRLISPIVEAVTNITPVEFFNETPVSREDIEILAPYNPENRSNETLPTSFLPGVLFSPIPVPTSTTEFEAFQSIRIPHSETYSTTISVIKPSSELKRDQSKVQMIVVIKRINPTPKPQPKSPLNSQLKLDKGEKVRNEQHAAEKQSSNSVSTNIKAENSNTTESESTAENQSTVGTEETISEIKCDIAVSARENVVVEKNLATSNLQVINQEKIETQNSSVKNATSLENKRVRIQTQNYTVENTKSFVKVKSNIRAQVLRQKFTEQTRLNSQSQILLKEKGKLRADQRVNSIKVSKSASTSKSQNTFSIQTQSTTQLAEQIRIQKPKTMKSNYQRLYQVVNPENNIFGQNLTPQQEAMLLSTGSLQIHSTLITTAQINEIQSIKGVTIHKSANVVSIFLEKLI
jgi:hypothetical protein